jgi:preprotein translocase subunit YajC
MGSSMSKTNAEQCAAPAGTAPAAVISPESGEVDQTNVPAHETHEAQPQSIVAAKTQVATPAPTNGTSANAEVPANHQALGAQPPIVPLPANEALTFLGVKPDIKDMTLEEKFTCLKQCFTYGYGLRKVLCEVFESIRAEFKTYKKDRAGMPTVEEAFKQRGLDYKTVYSAIQREKDRRAEDAQFFAAIKAQASTKNIHGLDVTVDGLPIGTKVVLSDGTKGQVLTVAEKKSPDSERSFEVVTEEGTAVQVKREDLLTLAEKKAAKAVAKAAMAAAKNAPEAGREAEEKETARIAAAAAEEDAKLKSSDFYKEQYFQLLSLVNSAPKEMTPAEFAQTVNDNLRVAYDSLNAEEAKLIKPGPQFPVIGQGNENKLFTFLSEDRVGGKSLLDSVFGGIDEGSFLKHVRKFSQRICDKFHDGVYEVSVYSKNDRVVIDKAVHEKLVAELAALRKAVKVKTVKPGVTETPTASPLEPDADLVSTTKVGDKSERTPHGFYWEFVKNEKPYAVRDMNSPHLGIMFKCKSKTEADKYINDREREAAEATKPPLDGVVVPQAKATAEDQVCRDPRG